MHPAASLVSSVLGAPSAGIAFDASYGSSMVLQQSPAKACITGTLGADCTGATLTVLDAASGATYDVAAALRPPAPAAGSDRRWKACLTPAPAGGDFTLTARCDGGGVRRAGAAPPPLRAAPATNISAVTFGEVWYCGGEHGVL